MQQLIVIEGPTASGKTALSVALAKMLHTVVISADSRQFYKELSIGTAKPTPTEMDGVPHYFVDSHSIHQPVTSGMFEKEAMQLLSTELAGFQHIVVAGGSGMFIDALCIGLDPIPCDPETASRIQEEFAQNGLEPLLQELALADPEYYHQVDRDNPARVMRALEVIRITGKTFSAWRANKPAPRPFSVKRFLISHPREQLYDRINQRVDHMVAAGLLQEAEAVHSFKHLAPLQTVGYKECFAYFEGEYDLKMCIDKIKQHTRNYAKRQLTWFNRHPDVVHIPFTDSESMALEIMQHIDH